MGQTREQRNFKWTLGKVASLEWHVAPLAMLITDAVLYEDIPMLRYQLRRLKEVGDVPNLQSRGELWGMRSAVASAISLLNPGETIHG